MHEYPLTQRIINIATEHATANNSAEVLKINLVVGEYSGYVVECIQLYFEIIAEGTICENAKLDIEIIKPMLKCKSCMELFERKPFSFECPYCTGEGEPTEIGREFYVKSIEVL